jgi:predicted nucleotidyltransferase
MTYTLPEHIKTKIRQIIGHYTQVERATLFGSHAKGTATERSDIDIAIQGQRLDRFVIADIALSFDDSDIPLQIDLQNYSEIKNTALKEHIDRIGIQLYPSND